MATMLGASQDSMGEHGALIAAVSSALPGHKDERILNPLTVRVMLCELSM